MRLHEVHPLEFRPLVPPAGVLVEARLLPAVEIPPQRRFLAGQFLWTGADAQGQDGDHREIGLKGAALVPIGRNAGKSVLRKCDLRPLTFTGPTRVCPPRPGILQSGPSRPADQVISLVVQPWRPRFGQPVF